MGGIIDAMSSSTKLVSSLAATMSVVIAIAMLQDGATIQDVAKVLFLLLGTCSIFIFIIARLRSGAQHPGSFKQAASATSRAQTTAFGILAGATFVISLQQLVKPVHSEDRTFGIAGMITALFIAFLAFRAYQKSRIRQLSFDGDIAEPNPKQEMELGTPKAVLIGITIFGLLFVVGNLRRIMSARRSDVWIGIGQTAIWLPILVYFGYREYRRMKNR